MSHETMNFISFFLQFTCCFTCDLLNIYWTCFFLMFAQLFSSQLEHVVFISYLKWFSHDSFFFHTWIFHVFWFFTHNHILFTWFHMSFLKFIFEISGHNHGIMFFTHEHMLLSYFHTMWYMITNEVYVIFR